jgi:hypothetical protein
VDFDLQFTACRDDVYYSFHLNYYAVSTVLCYLQPDFGASSIHLGERNCPKLPCSSHPFEAKTQPVALSRGRPARVWFDIQDMMEVWVEVKFAELLQLGMFEMFEPIWSFVFVHHHKSQMVHSQQDPTALTSDALRSPQVLAREIPHSVTNVQRVLCVVCSIPGRVCCHVR